MRLWVASRFDRYRSRRPAKARRKSSYPARLKLLKSVRFGPGSDRPRRPSALRDDGHQGPLTTGLIQCLVPEFARQARAQLRSDQPVRKRTILIICPRQVQQKALLAGTPPGATDLPWPPEPSRTCALPSISHLRGLNRKMSSASQPNTRQQGADWSASGKLPDRLQ